MADLIWDVVCGTGSFNTVYGLVIPDFKLKYRLYSAREEMLRMEYQRFEDLPVWKSAIELGAEVYKLMETPEFQGGHSLRDQIERAALSVSNNIAEGFERGTNQELLTFLYTARGSAGEVRSMLYLLSEIARFRNLESEIRNLRAKTHSISKQLGAWARSLQDSDLKGCRYVTGRTRQQAEQARQRAEFLRELEQVRKAARPLGSTNTECGE